MKTFIYFSNFVLLFFTLISCKKEAKEPDPSSISSSDSIQEETIERSFDSVKIERNSFFSDNLFPEGLDFDPLGNNFLITSLTKGIVSTVDMNYKVETIFDDPRLLSAIGIRVDSQRNRIIVLGSDPGVSIKREANSAPFKVARAFVFDLRSYELIAYIDFTELFDDASQRSFFANDIALASDGSFFVSDSKSSAIYKVDLDYNTSIFLEDERFMSNIDNFNLNGIAVNDEYLFVLNADSGLFFRISLSEKEIVEISSSDFNFINGDGMILDETDLYIIKNADSKIAKLILSSDFSELLFQKEISLSIDKVGTYPTTGFIMDDIVYVLDAHLDILFSGATLEEFSIAKVSIISEKEFK